MYNKMYNKIDSTFASILSNKLQPQYYCHCHYLRRRMPPFTRQCWGLQVGPMHETAGMGKLINAALLSLIIIIIIIIIIIQEKINVAFSPKW